MSKKLKLVYVVALCVVVALTMAIAGCKSPTATTAAAETTAAETTAAETTAAAETTVLIPKADDIILNGTVAIRDDDVGPEGDKSTPPAKITLGSKTFQDYIDMARAGKIEAEADIVNKVKGKTAAIVMNSMDFDWAQLQVAGLKMILEAFGIKVLSVTGGEWKATVQQDAIQNVIQLKPDVLLSIPVDQTIEGPIYKEAVNAGIKFVVIDMVPKGLSYKNGDYVTAVSASSRGNGTAAADIMADYFVKVGITKAKVAVLRLNFLHQVTEERALGFENRCAKYYPWIDTSIKADFDIADLVGSTYATTQGLLTKHSDLNGMFVVWDTPASGAWDACREAGIDPKTFCITTSDLTDSAALEIASGGYLKGLGSQDPFVQGVAESLSAVKALIGEEVPPFIAIPGYAVTRDNLLEAYKFLFQKEPPENLKKYYE
ncbi:MAG: substrate-binding domain-containing protein [Actinobacteria bacterium]|nr:substrate-binding domain-containing protein [Cyanobacteriota bacterium]MCL5771925.1 substrate-binding domain-containing protein [Actinomycetota bacterium]